MAKKPPSAADQVASAEQRALAAEEFAETSVENSDSDVSNIVAEWADELYTQNMVKYEIEAEKEVSQTDSHIQKIVELAEAQAANAVVASQRHSIQLIENARKIVMGAEQRAEKKVASTDTIIEVESEE